MSSAQARINESIPVVQLSVATFVRTNSDGSAQADFGQGEITVQVAGPIQRVPGEQVRVLRVDDAAVVIGQAIEIPPSGTVSAVGAVTVTVSTDAGSFELPWITTYSPMVGDVIAIAGGWVLGKPSVVLTSSYLSPGSAGQAGQFELEFRATDSGTFYVPSGAFNRNDVYAVGTTNNIGAWVYGSSISDSIPDDATINEVSIFTPELWNKFPSTLTQLGLHQLTALSGKPIVTSPSGIAAGTGWKSLPSSFGDALKTGASGGIGTGVSGEALYAGRSSDADSGKLRIKFTTT